MTENQKKPKTRTLDLNVTNVFYRNVEAIEQGYKVICNQGGSRSSKTWSIMQILLIRAIEGRKEVYTIGRQKLTWVKSTLLQDFKELTTLYGLKVTPDINPNRQEQVYFINGTEFAFFGLDYAEKIHGRKQDIFWLNEVMEIDKANYDQLEMRTNKFAILDYNPYDDTHWVFGLHKRPDVKVIVSTMLDNEENLPAMVVNKIWGYRPTEENYAKGTADPYMWDVYGLGKAAQLKGVIFPSWEILDDVPEDAKDLGYGLDFGFSNDPTTLVQIFKYDNTLILDEQLYEVGLVNVSELPDQRSINDELAKLNVGYSEITADSSEPKSIRELYNAGWNIEGVEKGADSVNYGIDLMKKFKIAVTRRSVNLQAELRKYKWTEDKNGKSLNKPVDEFNHAIDAARYRVMAKLGENFEVKLYPSSILG